MVERRLRTVPAPHKQASVLKFDVIPCFQGDGEEILLCGQCLIELAIGVWEEYLARQIATPVQLIIKCPKCQSFNLLSSQWIPPGAASG